MDPNRLWTVIADKNSKQNLVYIFFDKKVLNLDPILELPNFENLPENQTANHVLQLIVQNDIVILVLRSGTIVKAQLCENFTTITLL
ncbi:hypothetical protein [Leptospira interrogans]|uniref:hypothetical protein n=1 Tax=Leptospira interrogans TaxID=173 RepID=UPI00077332A7|nr:hypothetical protein [Leptospira interrogans]